MTFNMPWHAGVVKKNEEEWTSSMFFGSGPLIDMEETNDEVIVQAELPGLDPDDFAVEITGDRLVLRGERRHETEERRHGYYYAERSYGTFARAIALPCVVETDKATARYKNGLLHVTLPKTSLVKAKRITVQVRG